MIEKNEDNTDNDNNLVRIRLIADKRKFLEEQSSEVREDIKMCFAQLAQTLHARERQLLRQAEAIYRQQISLALSSQEFLPPSVAVLDEREVLEEQIRQFGRIELKGSNSNVLTNLEPYKIVDYQNIDKDHVSFDKSIKSEGTTSNANIEFSLMSQEKNVENVVSFAFENLNVIDLPRKLSNIPDSQKENLEENPNIPTKSNTDSQRNDFNGETIIEHQQDEGNTKNSAANFTEEQRNSCRHPEQVQQWLEQILLETEIEPTIHEVEKLPEIAEPCVCTKLQVET